jgi:hypothetical protein
MKLNMIQSSYSQSDRSINQLNKSNKSIHERLQNSHWLCFVDYDMILLRRSRAHILWLPYTLLINYVLSCFDKGSCEKNYMGKQPWFSETIVKPECLCSELDNLDSVIEMLRIVEITEWWWLDVVFFWSCFWFKANESNSNWFLLKHFDITVIIAKSRILIAVLQFQIEFKLARVWLKFNVLSYSEWIIANHCNAQHSNRHSWSENAWSQGGVSLYPEWKERLTKKIRIRTQAVVLIEQSVIMENCVCDVLHYCVSVEVSSASRGCEDS